MSRPPWRKCVGSCVLRLSSLSTSLQSGSAQGSPSRWAPSKQRAARRNGGARRRRASRRSEPCATRLHPAARGTVGAGEAETRSPNHHHQLLLLAGGALETRKATLQTQTGARATPGTDRRGLWKGGPAYRTCRAPRRRVGSASRWVALRSSRPWASSPPPLWRPDGADCTRSRRRHR